MGSDNWWVNALWSLTPTVLVGGIFWLVLRAILRADQRERDAYAREEKLQRQQRGLPPTQAKEHQ